MKDLIILVADLDIENVMQGLLPRLTHVLGTRDFSFDIKRHPYRDPGCMTGSADFLRPFIHQYCHALVCFDKEGSGQEKNSRSEIEIQVETELINSGWTEENIAAIAIEPELETWMWINSPKVSEALGWNGAQQLYDWLKENEWLEHGEEKPKRPKEAMEAVLKKTKKARSASIYRNIATNASFRNCKDKAFLKTIALLKKWFGPE